MSSDERRWINKIEKLANERPDQCVVMKHPEENGGFIYAKFPQKWVKVNPPKAVSAEQLMALASGLNKYREQKSG